MYVINEHFQTIILYILIVLYYTIIILDLKLKYRRELLVKTWRQHHVMRASRPINIII